VYSVFFFWILCCAFVIVLMASLMSFSLSWQPATLMAIIKRLPLVVALYKYFSCLHVIT